MATPAAATPNQQPALPPSGDAIATPAAETHPVPAHPAPPARNFNPRKVTFSTSGSTSLPALLHAAETFTAQVDIDHSPQSSYVPSARHFYQVVNEMDLLMATTRRFYDANHLWHPVVSKLMFGTLFMIQIMRAQKANGLLDHHLTQFLTWFEDTYPLSSILIPGPLVPFFQSLVCFSAPFENYGNISPTLPRTCSASDATTFFLNHGHSYLLPPIPYLMDQIIQFVSGNNAPTNAAPFCHLASATPHNFNIHGRQEIDGNANLLACTPCIQTDFAAPLHIETNFFNSRNMMTPYMPTRTLAANALNMTWTDYMHFSVAGSAYTANWFTRFLPTMNKYAQFFKDSVTFSQLISTGQGASFVLMKPVDSALFRNGYNDNSADVPATTNPPVRRHIIQSHNRNFLLQGEHADPAFPPVSAQYAAVTALNIDFTGLNRQGNPFPTAANTRFGPVWDLTANKRTNIVDTTRSFGACITNHYHVDTRQTSN